MTKKSSPQENDINISIKIEYADKNRNKNKNKTKKKQVIPSNTQPNHACFNQYILKLARLGKTKKTRNNGDGAWSRKNCFVVKVIDKVDRLRGENWFL